VSESLDPSLLDALDDVLLTFDEELTLGHWNRTLETVTGYEPETLETMSPTTPKPSPRRSPRSSRRVR